MKVHVKKIIYSCVYTSVTILVLVQLNKYYQLYFNSSSSPINYQITNLIKATPKNRDALLIFQMAYEAQQLGEKERALPLYEKALSIFSILNENQAKGYILVELAEVIRSLNRLSIEDNKKLYLDAQSIFQNMNDKIGPQRPHKMIHFRP